jgi:serine protease Do
VLSWRFNWTATRGLRVAALLGSSTLGGFVNVRAATADTHAPIAPATVSPILPDFAALVSNVKPAVVSITVRLNPEAVVDDGQQGPTPFGGMAPEH